MRPVVKLFLRVARIDVKRFVVPEVEIGSRRRR